MASRRCTPTLLQRTLVFHDLIKVSPPQATTEVVNKTNGITFRRWLYEANPVLTGLLVEQLGDACSRPP